MRKPLDHAAPSGADADLPAPPPDGFDDLLAKALAGLPPETAAVVPARRSAFRRILERRWHRRAAAVPTSEPEGAP